VPITTDKGLCGGVNGNIVRECARIVANSPKDTYMIFCVGDKGQSALKRTQKDILIRAVQGLQTPYGYYNVAALADLVSQTADQNECHTISILHNTFINAMTFKVTRIELLSYEKWMEMQAHN